MQLEYYERKKIPCISAIREVPRFRAATGKHTKVGQNYFKRGKRTFLGGSKYTKYNKINSNLENFRGKAPVVAGLLRLFIKIIKLYFLLECKSFFNFFLYF